MTGRLLGNFLFTNGALHGALDHCLMEKMTATLVRLAVWLSSAEQIHWKLRDPDTGKENMDIEWSFEVGDVVKIRIYNDPETIHPMNHPFHVHGQRFLVIALDGVPNENLVWKDTAIVPVGTTMDILVDITNPGEWMAHCHIAEHLHAGMMTSFTVTEP